MCVVERKRESAFTEDMRAHALAGTIIHEDKVPSSLSLFTFKQLIQWIGVPKYSINGIFSVLFLSFWSIHTPNFKLDTVLSKLGPNLWQNVFNNCYCLCYFWFPLYNGLSLVHSPLHSCLPTNEVVTHLLVGYLELLKWDSTTHSGMNEYIIFQL